MPLFITNSFVSTISVNTVLHCDNASNISHVYGFTEFVGFSAYATSGSQTPAAGDVIELSGVVTNAGGAYNPDTSTFTCPTTAYYYIYFSLNVHIYDPSYYNCRIYIMMDDSMIVEVRHDKHFGRAR